LHHGDHTFLRQTTPHDLHCKQQQHKKPQQQQQPRRNGLGSYHKILTTRKKDTNQKNKRTDKHTPKEQQHRQTETERQQQAYPPLLQTLKAVVLGINYPSIVRGIVVVFCVALIQNSLAVVIAVGGGRDSVRKRILPHFVGSCSKAKKQALLATTATSIARNAYKPPTEAFRKTASAKVRRGARTSPQLQGRSC